MATRFGIPLPSFPSLLRTLPLVSLTLVPMALGQTNASQTGSREILLIRGDVTPAGQLGGTFTTIQAAVNAALDGDTVLIPPGTFTGPGNFNVLVDKELFIIGAGIGVTIVNPQGQGRGFMFEGDVITPLTGLLEDLTIQNGEANLGGGILLTQGASPSLRSLEIKDCSAESGGGIFSGVGTVWNAISLFLHDNHAVQSGGAIAMTMAQGFLRESDIFENSADIVGGGVSISNTPGFDETPPIRITSVLFRENTAANSGGGLYSEMTDDLRINRCLFFENSTEDGGGGVEIVGDLLVSEGDDLARLQNSIIAKNTAPSGAGVRATLGSLLVQNCTIADNDASVHTGGLLVQGDALVLVNTILWGNDSPDGSVQVKQVDFTLVPPASRLILNNDVQGGVISPTSISANPLFVNPGQNNYHIGVGSPCIDAGFGSSDFFLLQEDIDGQARVIGNAIDIGADERVVDTRPLGVVAANPTLQPR